MTERSAPTAEELTGDKRLLYDHLIANPHHLPPMRRWKVRDRAGMPSGRALYMLAQDLAAANAKHGRAS